MDLFLKYLFEILLGVIAIINGVAGYFVVKAKNQVNKEDAFRDDILRELQSIREENKQLRKDYEKLLKEHNDLKLQFALVEKEWRTKIELFESAHKDLPVPMWLKDREGVMLSLNDSYESVFLRPRGYTRDDYVGNHDTAVWEEQTAKIFSANDRHVLRRGVTWRGIERLEMADGTYKDWHIVKYVRYIDGYPIGIGGFAFDPDVTD